jgi:hypothetical protein
MNDIEQDQELGSTHYTYPCWIGVDQLQIPHSQICLLENGSSGTKQISKYSVDLALITAPEHHFSVSISRSGDQD